MTQLAVPHSPPTPVAPATTYRCRNVLLSGIVCIVLGVAGITWLVVGAMTEHTNDRIAWTIVAGGAGVMLLVLGIGCVLAKLVVTPTTLVVHWMFATETFRLDELTDAAITTPGPTSSFRGRRRLAVGPRGANTISTMPGGGGAVLLMIVASWVAAIAK